MDRFETDLTGEERVMTGLTERGPGLAIGTVRKPKETKGLHRPLPPLGGGEGIRVDVAMPTP